MQIGYARVSTDDQNTAVQVPALKPAGVSAHKEKASVNAGTGPNSIDYSTNLATMTRSSRLKSARWYSRATRLPPSPRG
jgi:DNA invertase Pin-like site-specific DNA recombinase